MDRRLSSLLSLAAKSGNITTGEDSCVRAIRNGSAKLVIVATDASDNTRKKFKDKAGFYNVPHCEFSAKEELNKTIGKSNRATLVITDAGFAGAIKELTR